MMRWRCQPRRRSNEVFDEADMFLCGSFQNQVIRLINMLCFEEKSLSKFNSSEVENSEKLNSDPSMDLEAECGEDVESPQDLDEESLGGPRDGDGDFGNRPTREKDWRRVRKIYAWSKQYIFVAATLPERGKRTAGGFLKRMFPESRWAEFATSAVDFLHRVGRTGRADRPGRVTSLYNDSNRDLVAAVRQARNQGRHVEKAFSRKRSFRNKLKKGIIRFKDESAVAERV